jgi:Cysteine rich repeat
MPALIFSKYLDLRRNAYSRTGSWLLIQSSSQEKIMKRVLILTAVCILSLIQPICAATSASKGPVEIVAQGCETEIKSYCSDVTLGEGRLLACLYAHSDKISSRCEYAFYDAAVQLERAVAAISFVANECRDDLMKLCANVPPGEGRLLECLDQNAAKVSDRCQKAVKDVSGK